jgi:DNA-directed RNA polymerase subunit L
MSGYSKPRFWRHNEIAFEDFFIKNRIEWMIKYDRLNHTPNPVANFDPTIHNRLLETNKYSELAYYSTNKWTLEKMVENCEVPVFNVHLFQISQKHDLIKKITSPIIFLIRKNNWQRMISQYLHTKRMTPAHVEEDSSPNQLKQIDIEIGKNDLDEMIEAADYQWNLIRTFQKELKDQENIKFIYYEDIQHPSYWTEEFIDSLEDFMKIKFTNRNYQVPLVKTRDLVNLLNKEDIMTKELVEKYYIEESL